MQYSTTGGALILTSPNCDCGLTGGCEKCRPFILTEEPVVFLPKQLENNWKFTGD